MKELVAKLKNDFTPYGYQKSRNSFWKIENGFYRLIDFQKGAYGDYLFINVCLHPAGLPSLIAGKLEIKERPREYECIIRQRIGEIVSDEPFKKALIPIHDADTIPRVVTIIPAVEAWLSDQGSFDAIVNKDFPELSKDDAGGPHPMAKGVLYAQVLLYAGAWKYPGGKKVLLRVFKCTLLTRSAAGIQRGWSAASRPGDAGKTGNTVC